MLVPKDEWAEDGAGQAILESMFVSSSLALEHGKDLFDIDSAHSHARCDGVTILVKKSEIPQPGVVCFDQPGDLGLLGEWCAR